MKRYYVQPANVASLPVGTMVNGKGLSDKASKGICPCCNQSITAHKWVMVVPCNERPNTNYRAFVGIGCKRATVPADIRKNAPKLEIRIPCIPNPDMIAGAFKWTLKEQAYEWTLERGEKGHFTGYGILTVYIPDKLCAVAKLGKSLSMTGVGTMKQRMTANGETTEWTDIDTATWRPFFKKAKYAGRKAYNV